VKNFQRGSVFTMDSTFKKYMHIDGGTLRMSLTSLSLVLSTPLGVVVIILSYLVFGLTHWFVGVLLALALFTLFMLRVVHVHFSNPLLRFSQGIRELDSQTPLEGTSCLELSKVNDSFSALTTSLYDKDIRVSRTLNTLEDLVAERTLELLKTNTELLLANELAESAAHAKSVFLTHMSTSLRTPLNGIQIYAELLTDALQELPVSSDALDDVKRIQKSADQLLETIDRILDYAQVEIGHINIESDTILLIDFIKECESLSRSMAKKGNNWFDLMLSPNLPTYISTDHKKLKHVLISLLDNANKFTHKGHVRLHIDDDGDFLVFTISDTGVGIPPEDLKSMFVEFISSNKKGVTSLGLGLTLTKKYLDLLGGTISVRSTLKHGTVFTVKIPKLAKYLVRKNSSTVLIMLPDTPVRNELISKLTQLGLWTTVVETLDECIKISTSLGPQTIILGITRPEDWDTLLQLGNSLPQRCRVLCIQFAEDSMEGSIVEVREIVKKPIKRDHLAYVLNSYAAPRKSPRVLIIEDDRVTALALSRQVESLGWKTTVVFSAEAALPHLEVPTIDLLPSLVLLDLGLPGMGGAELLETHSHIFRDLPVVVVTGSSVSGGDLARINMFDTKVPISEIAVGVAAKVSRWS